LKLESSFAPYDRALKEMCLTPIRAKIIQVIGLVLESSGLSASMGEICQVFEGTKLIGQAEVVGFRRKTTLLMALDQLNGLKPGMEVMATGKVFSVGVGKQLLGRVINGLGEPIDGKGPILLTETGLINNNPPSPLDRRRITEPMITGIRAIDGFKTLGKGQRVGLFAGSGVGKSVLLGMIARNCLSAVNVIALIGERGREVKEFLEKDLGPEGLERSVVVVATSDQPALVRIKAAQVATTVAEYFRDLGNDVMLMMDSSTRLAMAQREIGLAIGEPPSTRGYTPSVFAFLPRLFERAGMSKNGSITGIYTVLVEGDDMDEPIADAVRSVLDGHIVLARSLAHRNHFPAIDVLKSVSRCISDITHKDHRQQLGKLLNAMAVYADAEDMVNLGAYVRGSNPLLDQAIALHSEIEKFLIQAVDDQSDYRATLEKLTNLSSALK